MWQRVKKQWRMITLRTVAWGGNVARSKYGLPAIGLLSFLESALPVPILTDPFLLGFVLANRARALQAWFIVTLTSVVGGVVAIWYARYFFDTLITFLSPNQIADFESITAASGDIAWLTLVGAVTPVPYTITAWVVGALEGSIFIFIIISILSRGGRYAIVAGCAYFLGPTALQVAKRYLGLSSLIVIVGAALFVLLKM